MCPQWLGFSFKQVNGAVTMHIGSPEYIAHMLYNYICLPTVRAPERTIKCQTAVKTCVKLSDMLTQSAALKCPHITLKN